MNSRIALTMSTALLIPCTALSQNESSAAPPDDARGSTRQVSPDRYADLNKHVQEKLRALGLYAGPVNGDFGPNTQAALAQFQLSVPLPASGMLDDQTLAALGVEPPAQASAGASSEDAGAQSIRAN